jgi:hypothetical protein
VTQNLIKPNPVIPDGTTQMPEPIQTPEEGTEVVEQPTETPAEPSQPAPPAPPAPKPEETVDYWKDKFSASASENERLREAQAARERAEQESTNQPTDSELRQAFPSWDLYDDTQKEFARETFAAKRTAANAQKIAETLQRNNEWNTSVEMAILSTPVLQGKEQAFRQYASQQKYRGAPMELLVSGFLGTAPAAPAPAPTPKPGLEPGNGGPRTPERPKPLTTEQLSTLRQTDPKAYQEYLKTHKIEDIDL